MVRVWGSAEVAEEFLTLYSLLCPRLLRMIVGVRGAQAP